MMLALRLLLGMLAVSISVSVTGFGPARAQTPADMAAAVTKTCGVMDGTVKPDRQALQLLLLLDGDMADANPIEIGLYRGVLHQCPKAYLGYEQRLRTHNPFANGSLVKGQSQLTGSGTPLVTNAAPAEFPIRCRGGHGIASADGKTLVVKFARSAQSAAQRLGPGQCSWVDRAVRPGEPATIETLLGSAAEVDNGVAQINAGGTWTFWVTSTNAYLRASAIAKGTPSKKP